MLKPSNSGSEHQLLISFISVNVIGRTTTPGLRRTKTELQVKNIDLLPFMYGGGLSTTFPCPLELFVEIIRINHLRSIKTDSQTPCTHVHQGTLDVRRRIADFSPEKWAHHLEV